jgi:predicted PurR-regulated permease PerM
VFDSPWKAVGIIAFAVVYQQVETYFLTPRISKRTMDVNPAIALAAVFVGGAIWGPLGAIIGIPLAAAGVAVLGTYRRRYELIPELAGGTDLLVDEDTSGEPTPPEAEDARLTE